MAALIPWEEGNKRERLRLLLAPKPDTFAPAWSSVSPGKRFANACDAMAPRLKCTSCVPPDSGSVPMVTRVSAFSVSAPGLPYLGYVGACEGDMDSTLTMLLFRYAFGVPGFISDPIFDFAKNGLIHAHCTSTTKLDGVAGERAPFLIRTQCDSEQGVSLEVEMRVGQEITCAKFANNDTLLVSAGKITEVPDYSDRGCRTQIVTEVRDARKMFANWGGGVLPNDMMTLLHRVVFYGNRLRDLADLAALMGLKVVEEG